MVWRLDIVLQFARDLRSKLAMLLDDGGWDGDVASCVWRGCDVIKTAVVSRQLHRGAGSEPVIGNDGDRNVESGGEGRDGDISGGGEVV